MDVTDRLLHELESGEYIKEEELAERLGVPFDEIKHAVHDLEEAYTVGRSDGGKVVLNSTRGVYRGKLDKKAAGFGFVSIGGDMRDVFVPEDAQMGALSGEDVIVKVKSAADDGRSEGEIIEIISKLPVDVVGIYHLPPADDEGYVQGQGTVVVRIPNDKAMGAENEDRVVAEITERGTVDTPPSGRIKEILGKKGEKGIDILVYARRFGLTAEFPEDCMKQAREVAKDVPSPDGRLDLRNELIITIDGADSKDLDDAISLKRLPNGNWELGVHIADVSHYVTEGSPLDREALERGTSVYLVDRVVPMLPKELSNGICSLNPHEEKATLSCIMELDPSGKQVGHQLANTIIRSTERMTYDDVNFILEGDPELRKRYEHIVPMLENMNAMAKKLRRRRFEAGSIDFELPEPKIAMNDEGRPVSITVRERGDAEKLIEEFMLSANVTVAEQFYDMDLPFLYRVHDKPDPEKVRELATFLKNIGIHMKGISDVHPRAFQEVLNKVAGTPEAGIVSTITLRSLQKAEYSTQPIGHFGLAADEYCHFTSPIRRYPDLEVHRLVKKMLAGKLDKKECGRFEKILPGIAKQSSERERNAITAERAVVAMEMAEYMQDHLFEKTRGVISGVTNFGIFVELANTVEGMIPMSSLIDDYYVYHEKLFCLIGEHSRRRLTLGDKIRVQAVGADPEAGKIEFAPLGLVSNTRTKGPRTGKGKSAAAKKAAEKHKPAQQLKRQQAAAKTAKPAKSATHAQTPHRSPKKNKRKKSK